MRRSVPAYELMSNEDESTGLNSAMPGPEIPYSVSMPMTLGIAMGGRLQVLARVDPFDLAALAASIRHQGADVDDPLALLARDPGPVVGVRRVGQVLVLLELVADGAKEVLALDALLPLREEALDRRLLGAGDDVL